MRPDGTAVRRLTRNGRGAAGAPVRDMAPAWSPDGERLAFVSERHSPEGEIYVMNANGTGVRRLTRTAAGSDENSPAWSPDGRRLAFTSNRSGQHDLYVMNADGSGIRRIGGSKTLDDVFPRWTADGTQLVFATFPGPEGSPRMEVWAIRSDGTGRRQITTSPADDAMPDPQRARRR